MLSMIKLYFSRIIAILLSIAAMLSGGDLSKVNLKITNIITTKSEHIEYEIQNYTGTTISVDRYYVLEMNNGGEWTELEQINDVYDTAYVLKNTQVVTLKINIFDSFGRFLDAGQYRLTIQYNPSNACSVYFDVV